MPTKENNAGQQQPYDSEGKFTNFSSENAHPKGENVELKEKIEDIVKHKQFTLNDAEALWEYQKIATPKDLEELKKKGFSFEVKKGDKNSYFDKEDVFYIRKQSFLEDGRKVEESVSKKENEEKYLWEDRKKVEKRETQEAIDLFLKNSDELENQDVSSIKNYISANKENKDRLREMGIVIGKYGILEKITENYDGKGGEMIDNVSGGIGAEDAFKKAFHNIQYRSAEDIEAERKETRIQKDAIVRKKDAINKYSDIKDIDTAMKFLDTKENEDAIFENLDDPLYEEPSFNKGGGYSGRSMSNRAVLAYEAGQRPKTKWTKEDFMDRISDVSELEPFYDEIEKMSLAEMKDNLLERSSWHHTGAMASATNFYGVISPRQIYQYLKDRRSKKFANFKKKEE
jgi:hypothetical protein